MLAADIKQDFLRLLNADEEFKAEVRNIILTEELLKVPTTLSEMSSRQNEMSDRQAEMQDVVTGMQNVLTRTQDVVIGMQRIVNRMQDDVGELKGLKVEFRLERRIVAILSALLNQRNGIIVRGGHHNAAASQFDEDVYDAYTNNAISERERDRINNTDVVVRATSRQSGETVYSVVEASWVIDDNDVIRARQSAEIVAKMYPDAKAEAVVYGKSINERGKDAAERLGVHVSDSA